MKSGAIVVDSSIPSKYNFIVLFIVVLWENVIDAWYQVLVINNKLGGIIHATASGQGTINGIDLGGDVTTMEINNSGTIQSTRTNGDITLTTNKYDFLRGTTSANQAANIGSAAAVYSQEEVETLTLNNKSGGKLIGEGDFNPALYMRAGEQIVNNDGEISGSRKIVSGAGTLQSPYIYSYGMAIGSVSDGGEVRTLHLKNSEDGVINGAILGVNANAYRWYALSNFNIHGYHLHRQ